MGPAKIPTAPPHVVPRPQVCQCQNWALGRTGIHTVESRIILSGEQFGGSVLLAKALNTCTTIGSSSPFSLSVSASVANQLRFQFFILTDTQHRGQRETDNRKLGKRAWRGKKGSERLLLIMLNFGIQHYLMNIVQKKITTLNRWFILFSPVLYGLVMRQKEMMILIS